MLKKDILPAVTTFELTLKKSLDEDDDLDLLDEDSYEYRTVKLIKRTRKSYSKT